MVIWFLQNQGGVLEGSGYIPTNEIGITCSFFITSRDLNGSTLKLYLVGGFLGSGKTTAIVNISRRLVLDKKKVAVITNDQGNQQVDSALIKSLGIPGKEVAHGCFCCQYDQLDSHIQALTKDFQPDVIFAESVGSCTDLVATIAKPMAVFRPKLDVVISVFADARLLSSLLEGTSLFIKESVRYIFKKQLEEADLLVINKADLVSPGQKTLINDMIKREYPGKLTLFQNSLEEGGIRSWLESLDHIAQPVKRVSLELDYGKYGEGEAELAWLDKSISIRSNRGDAVMIASKIIRTIHKGIQEHRLTIGHLKFFIETENWKKKISFTSTGADSLSWMADQCTDWVSLLINARVQTDPELLGRIVDAALAQTSQDEECAIEMENVSVFKPGYPRPTHRVD